MAVRKLSGIITSVTLVGVAVVGTPFAAAAVTSEPPPTPDPKAALVAKASPDPALDAEFPAYETDMNSINAALSDLMLKYPDIVGELSWDNTTKTRTIDYYTGADAAEETAFLSAAKSIVAPSPYALAWQPVDWSYKARLDLLADITGHPSDWVSVFGAPPEAGSVDSAGVLQISRDPPR